MEHKISVVNFFFAQCGSVCPLLMQNLKTVRKKIPGNIHFYSISVTPKDDTPEELKMFANHYSINEKTWDLLTGSEKTIFELGRNVFKADKAPQVDQEKGTFIHSDNVYLIDKNLHIRGIYPGLNTKQLALLVPDVKMLSRE
jgi:protein SCO1/2